MTVLPNNIITKQLLVTDLSQQLKKQRDFLKWMARRYLKVNPEQSAAFTTGAQLFDELRRDLLDGLFDAPAELPGPGETFLVKELFTEDRLEELAGALELQKAVSRNAAAAEERRQNIGRPGYTYDGRKKCGDAWCDYADGHEGHHSND